MRTALIGGHAIHGFGRGEERTHRTASGEVTVLDAGELVVLPRHGLHAYRAPHAIDHRVNLTAVRELGCERILAVGSVGALRPELQVGTFLAPHDFIALQLGLSLSDAAEGHQVPGFDRGWRELVIDAWATETDIPLTTEAVYWQAIGPRFETPAEIRLLAAHADVVGMTIASECVLAGELGLPYAAICVVDNLANGVAGEELTIEEFEAGRRRSREGLASALGAVLPVLEELG
jgi:5'-methylthioadenosine phosphorylase